jgi:two-component system chemotaxis sensor kinase CheA
LRGTVDIESELGHGTRIIIRLPLTLAIIDGFHVSVVDGSYIIPLDMVVECVTLNDEQRIEAQQHDYICLREEVLPLLNLESYFNIDTPPSTEESATAHTRQNLVVVRFSNKKAGLLVDTLHGEVQAVIKPLGRVFHGLNGFSGFTILGSGQVAMILDVPGLIQGAGKRDVETHAALASSQKGDQGSALILH